MTVPITRNLALAGVLLLAACSGGSGGPGVSAGPTATASVPMATASTTEQPSQSSFPSPATSAASASPEPMTPSPTSSPIAAYDQPWATAELTDVSTGERFRIADLAAEGKVVFLETMAIWCSSCHAQQVAAAQAFQQLDPQTVEWVAIDIETTETADALARYRLQNGFPFHYAVADTSLSRALADQFGDVVLSPPSVNVIVLRPDGQIEHLRGHNDAARLIALATQ